ncbi:MAG: PemK family transcriptional regulator [Planctomycetes bacterium RBG_16_59_8]|nr:MAG: PemK family transcriptional regulator [Planctomycetes bacterium RBG_16_59_8]
MNRCRRGEIWLVNFAPGRGSEQQGVRPALVIQNDIGNQHASTTIVAAITTTTKSYPFTVLLDRRESGLPKPSMVNLAQVLTIDQRRMIRKMSDLPPETMGRVNEAIRVSLDIFP